MLRVGYMSDIHLEFEESGPDHHPTGAWFALQKARRALVTEGHPSLGPLFTGLHGEIDLMVIAGDTNTSKGRRKGMSSVRYADQVARYLDVPVVIIAGNHEAYGGDLDEEIQELRKEAAETEGCVTFLEREGAVFDLPGGRLHVLGCTLWTDFALFGNAEAAMKTAAEGMNDFRGVRYRGAVFMPTDACELYLQSKVWLRESIAAIRAAEPGASILVVTHHAPSTRSIPADRLDDPLVPAYASNLEAEIATWRPSAWIHGQSAYDVAGIPIRSAARGYVGHEAGAESFRPQVVTLGR